MIEQTKASPTTKYLMRVQSKRIKTLEQQVQGLTSVVQELLKRSMPPPQNGSTQNTSGSGGSNNSNSGFSNMFSTVGGAANKNPPESDENQLRQARQLQLQSQHQNPHMKIEDFPATPKNIQNRASQQD